MRERKTERERKREKGENVIRIPGPEHPEKDGSDHGEEIVGVVGSRLLTLRSTLVVQHPHIGYSYTLSYGSVCYLYRSFSCYDTGFCSGSDP